MSGLEKSSRKRKPKTSLTQYELYVNMLETNPYFRENKVTPDHPNELSQCWETLVKNLNSSGGPQKNIVEWKRVFVDWKCQIRKRARLIKNSFKETGNEGAPEKELTELEKKLLYLTGEIVTEGIPCIPELGVENEENIEKAVIEEENEARAIEETKIVSATKRKREANILISIDTNLKSLVELKKQEVELKKKEIELMKMKLSLKYNVSIVDENENEAGRSGDVI